MMLKRETTYFFTKLQIPAAPPRPNQAPNSNASNVQVTQKGHTKDTPSVLSNS